MELDFDLGGVLYERASGMLPDSVGYNVDLGVLNGLFGAQFGISVQRLYDVSLPGTQPDHSNKGMPYWGTDGKGRNMFLPVRLGYDVQGQKRWIQLPLPVITIDTANNWRMKLMGRRNGTAKNDWGADDYAISIRGFCSSGFGRWPEEQIQALKELESTRVAFDIENVLTGIFLEEPQKVIIQRMKIFETNRFNGLVPYRMDLLSDTPFTLIEDE